MRKVNRLDVQIPESLDGKESKGARETTDALAHFKNKKNKSVEFSFEVYKKKDIKLALEILFEGKCAYCESSYRGTSKLHVEHFRPKAEIKNSTYSKDGRPGYYWLGAVWENLLPSCQNCNQETYQIIYGQPYSILTGKGNCFPLQRKVRGEFKPGVDKRERPLLIDPTVDDPNQYLEFTEDGLVYSVKDKNGNPNKRGEATIQIFGLLREELVIERRSVATALRTRIINIREYERRLHEDPHNAYHEHDLNRELDELVGLIDSSREFYGMIVQLLTKHNFL
ncbi:hypothetical protein [Bdellovibrio sp. HCB274]|uniref:hypothetical protein n=1 Tax=Bdellovibrio sp. HCB274 TaxID=3394361 RepID=UPI0039B496FC